MTSSHPPSIQELKKTLIAAGLEIYRTRPDAVHLAERPRDNQILDAGISIRPAPTTEPPGAYEVRVVMRCQRSDFPREAIDDLYQRVRVLAKEPLIDRGVKEIEQREQRMLDPGDKSKTLDVWYELIFSRFVPDVSGAISEARHALAYEKYVKGHD